MNANHQRTVACAACLDDFPESAAIPIGGDHVCEDCFYDGIEPTFYEAIEHEGAFPVKYGGQQLRVQDYVRYLGDSSYVSRYNFRGRQYAIPTETRIYCRQIIRENSGPPAGCVVRGMAALTQAEQEEVRENEPTRNLVRCNAIVNFELIEDGPCYNCGGSTCPRCGDVLTPGEHVCRRLSARGADAMGKNFEGMTRGVEYQLCPACHTVIELRDGCNHVACTCKVDFCYTCGEVADPNGTHWNQGRCRRYGAILADGTIRNDATEVGAEVVQHPNDGEPIRFDAQFENAPEPFADGEAMDEAMERLTLRIVDAMNGIQVIPHVVLNAPRFAELGLLDFLHNPDDPVDTLTNDHVIAATGGVETFLALLGAADTPPQLRLPAEVNALNYIFGTQHNV